MANNRMVIVCNKCVPDDNWVYGADVCYTGKWYPVGNYVYIPDEALGNSINTYLKRHAHTEDVPEPHSVNNTAHRESLIQNENPVRLTYETWVRDMPPIKGLWRK